MFGEEQCIMVRVSCEYPLRGYTHTHTHTHTHTQDEEEIISPWSFSHWFVVTLKFVYSSGESLGYGFEQHPNKTARGLSILFSKEMTLDGSSCFQVGQL